VLWHVGISTLRGGGGGGGGAMFICRDLWQSEDMHRSQDQRLSPMLCINTVDFIGSCCRFFVGWIIYYCLKIDLKLFQGIQKFSFLYKM
jgi:hypothetical protein